MNLKIIRRSLVNLALAIIGGISIYTIFIVVPEYSIKFITTNNYLTLAGVILTSLWILIIAIALCVICLVNIFKGV
jgi:hypothetical protein